MGKWRKKERDPPSDEEREIIEDEDMEDSATDIPELWSPDRNDEDTKFVRGQGHAIPTKKCPQAASEVDLHVQQEMHGLL